jgi:hypothetical protein
MSFESRDGQEIGQSYKEILDERARERKEIILGIFLAVIFFTLGIGALVFLYSTDPSSETFIKK